MSPKSRWLLALPLIVGLLIAIGRHSLAYPEPAIVPKAWQFDVTFSTPQPISFKTPDGRVRWFWYVTYTVTNNTDRERLFIPDITIATDEGDIMPAGRGVPPGVFEATKARLQNKLLESPVQVVGKLLRGPDNAKDSLAIWPATEHDIDAMSIFIAGLSGETTVVNNPVTDDPVLMTKTLMVDVALPGNPPNPEVQAVLPQGHHWVMR